MVFNKKSHVKKQIKIALLVLFSAALLARGVLIVYEGVQPLDAFCVFVLLVMAVMAALPWVVYFLWTKKKWRIEKIYLVCGLVVGTVYVFLVPPGETPDENAHISTAYHVSNVLLHKSGEREASGWLAMRQCDADIDFSQGMSRDTYNYLLAHAFEAADDTSAVEEPASLTKPAVLYLVSGVGIALGRILHLGGMTVVLLGTWFNVLFFVLLMYYAIKKLPFGKLAFFAMAMMPMTLQQTSSLSYDNMAIATAFLVTALSLRFAYGPPVYQKREIIIYAAASVFLVLSKGGAYSLLVFLPFLLMASKKRLTKKNLLLVAAVVAAVAVVAFRGQIAAVFTDTAQAAESLAQDAAAGVTAVQGEGTYIFWDDSYAWSMAQLLQNPQMLVRILYRTLYDNCIGTMSYMETMVGSSLSWLNVAVPQVLVYGFIVVMLIGCLKTAGEKRYIRNVDRIGMWVIAALSAVACVMAMLLNWTPAGSQSVEGVQGRYFLPLLPVAAVSLRNNTVVLTKDRELFWIEALLVLQGSAVLFVFLSCVG